MHMVSNCLLNIYGYARNHALLGWWSFFCSWQLMKSLMTGWKKTVECSFPDIYSNTPTPGKARRHFRGGGERTVRAGGWWKAVIYCLETAWPLRSSTQLAVRAQNRETKSLQHEMDIHLGINTAYQKIDRVTQTGNTHVNKLKSVPEKPPMWWVWPKPVSPGLVEVSRIQGHPWLQVESWSKKGK